MKDYLDEYSEFISVTIICLTKNIINIPSHFCVCYTKACVCYHDGAGMPCIRPHVLVANILIHRSSSLGIYGLSLYGLSFLWTSPFLYFWQPTSTERSDCQYIKTTFFCTLTIVTILVTELKVNSGGYLLYCFAAWWISTSFTDTDRSEWICYYISHRYQKISLFLSIYQKLVRN